MTNSEQQFSIIKPSLFSWKVFLLHSAVFPFLTTESEGIIINNTISPHEGYSSVVMTPAELGLLTLPVPSFIVPAVAGYFSMTPTDHICCLHIFCHFLLHDGLELVFNV